jgi:precorrin-6B methylase 2
MTPLQKNAGKARLFQVASRWVQSLSAAFGRLLPPAVRLMNLSSAYWQSRSLYVAARLDLANVLGDAVLPLQELATRSGAHAESLRRLLRFLTAMGVFEEEPPLHYRNNALSNPLRTGTGDHNSVRSLILFHNSPEMARSWIEQLEAGIRSGEAPFRLAHGADLFDYMDLHPEFDAVFAAGMDDVEAIAGNSFVTEFDWSRFSRLIDVGGSNGAKALSILRAHRQLRAVVVDRAQAVRLASAWWEHHATAEEQRRVTFLEGDARHSVPKAEGAGDVYMLSAVLHGLDDATCTTILKTLVAAAGDTDARIVIAEMILPERDTDLATASFDMQMFIGSRGRERTLTEWQALFAASAVVLDEVVQLASFAKLLVVTPARATPDR